MDKQTVSFRDIYASAFATWKKHFVIIATIAIVVYTPVQILIEIVSVIMNGAFPTDELRTLNFENTLYDLIRVLLGCVATIAVIKYVYLQLSENDEEQSAFDMVKVGLKLWSKFILANFIVGLKTLFYTLLLIIPGIYKGVRLSFYDCIVATKDESIDEICERSEYMVVNNWWKVFGFILLVFLIQLLIELAFVFPALMFSESHAISIILGVSVNVLTTYLVVVRTTYYYEIEKQIAQSKIIEQAFQLRSDNN